MKKLLVLIASIFMLLSIVGCSKKQEEPIENNNEEINVVEANDDGITTENNDMYDGERKVPDYNTMIATCDGIEVWSEGSWDYCINTEGVIIRIFELRNTSDKVVAFGLDDITEEDFSGSLKHIVDNGFVMITHPNGCTNYVMNPGDVAHIEYDFSIGNSSTNEDQFGDLITSYGIITHDEHGLSNKYTIEDSINISWLSKETMNSEQFNNATITGQIVDEDNNPIKDATVKVFCHFADLENQVQTDENGNYSIQTCSAKTIYANSYKEAALCVEKPGYYTRWAVAYPKPDQEVEINVALSAEKFVERYERVAEVDLGLQGYEYDTDHKSIITFVPFHTGIDSSKIKDLIKATTTDFDGNVKYTYQLPEEIPYVDVSKDAKYSVIAVNSSSKMPTPDGYKIVILDENGNEVYSRKDFPATGKPFAPDEENIKHSMSRCAELSNDNKYLVVGSADGDIWFIDWQKDEVIWSDYLYGQVRTIKFSNDNSEIYISTGDTNLYAFDTSGKQLWKTNIGSWATKCIVTENYIVLNTKSAGDNLKVLNRKDGSIKWSYPTMAGAMSVAVSPDEKQLWYGAHASSTYNVIGSSIFDLETGEIKYLLNHTNTTAAEYSKDGRRLVTRSNEDTIVYDAKTGYELWRDHISNGDNSKNFDAVINEDGTKFAVTYSPDVNMDYLGHAYFYKYVGQEERNAPSPNDNAQPQNQPQGPSSEVGGVVDLSSIENGAILTGDTTFTFNGPIERELGIDCKGYAVKLEGTWPLNNDSKTIHLGNASSVDASNVSFDNKIMSEGERTIIEFEMDNSKIVFPNGVEQADSPQSNKIVYMKEPSGGRAKIVYLK